MDCQKTAYSGFLLVAAVVATSVRAAEPSQVEHAVKRDATVMYESFVKGDFDGWVEYAYPKLVEMIGGKAQMIEMVKAGMADLRKRGTVLKAASVKAPDKVVKAGDELHALIPLTVVMTVPGGELHSTSHLLGISADDGRTWTFIDTASVTEESIRTALPSYNPELVLPAKSKPVFVPK